MVPLIILRTAIKNDPSDEAFNYEIKDIILNCKNDAINALF